MKKIQFTKKQKQLFIIGIGVASTIGGISILNRTRFGANIKLSIAQFLTNSIVKVNHSTAAYSIAYNEGVYTKECIDTLHKLIDILKSGTTFTREVIAP